MWCHEYIRNVASLRDSTYVTFINMDKHDSRRMAMNDHLNTMGLPCNRFKGVDGRSVRITSPLVDCAKILSAGEIGCTFSHISCLLQAPRDRPYILVMEDDCRIRHHIDIPQLWSYAPDDADIIQITPTPWTDNQQDIQRFRSSNSANIPFVPWNQDVYSTCGYLVKTSALRRLEQQVQLQGNHLHIKQHFKTYQADILLYNMLKTYSIVYPLAFSTDAFISTIHHETDHDEGNKDGRDVMKTIAPPCEKIKSCITL